MANNIDMMRDIDDLLRHGNTQKEIQQGYDLNDLYYFRYMVTKPNFKKIERLKKLYKEKYGFLDNYV